jgi:hypothetical protein
MDAEAPHEPTPSVSDEEQGLALRVAALLLVVGECRRLAGGVCLAASSAPQLHRGITGRWRAVLNRHVQPDNTRAALGGERGVHVRESVRLDTGRRRSQTPCMRPHFAMPQAASGIGLELATICAQEGLDPLTATSSAAGRTNCKQPWHRKMAEPGSANKAKS